MCEVCGVSMNPPCAIICLSDCSVCWVSYAPRELSQMDGYPVGVAKVVKEKGAAPKVDGSTRIKFCSQELSLAQITNFVEQIHPKAVLDSAARKSTAVFDLSFSGTLDELTQKLKPGQKV